MKTTFYIGTSLANRAAAEELKERLEQHGWECSHDWMAVEAEKGGHTTDPAELGRMGYNDFIGVVEADVVVILEPGRRGTYFEYGCAVGCSMYGNTRKEVFFVVPEGYEEPDYPSVFAHLNSRVPQVRRLVDFSTDELVEYLIRSVS